MSYVSSANFIRICALLLVCAGMICSQYTIAQESRIQLKRFTSDDGLSQNMITAMIQDRQGILWLGTKDGLNRFDGHNFQVFRHNPRKKASLRGNYISALHEDKDGYLWIATRQGGMEVRAPGGGFFHYLDNVPWELPSGESDVILQMESDTLGRVWLAGEHRLYCIVKKPGDPANQSVFNYQSHVVNPYKDSRPQVFSPLLKSRSGNLYLGTGQGLMKAQNLYSASPGDVRFTTIRESSITNLCQDQRGHIWFGDKDLHEYSPIENTFRTYSLGDLLKAEHTRLVSMVADPKKGVWVAAGKLNDGALAETKVYHYNPETRSFNDYPGLSQSISIKWHFSSDKLLWAGTPGYGLVRYDLQSAAFGFTDTGEFIHSMSNHRSDEVNFIHQPHPAFITTDRSGNTQVTSTLSLEHIPVDSLFKTATNPALPAIYKKAYPPAAITDRKGQLWKIHGEEDEQWLGRYNRKLEKTGRLELPGKNLKLLYTDHKGERWLMCEGDLFRIEEKNGLGYERFPIASSESEALEAQVMLRDRSGKFWIGTKGGLRTFSPDSGVETRWSEKYPELNYPVLSVLNDPLNPGRFIWIGTEGGGLVKINKQSGDRQVFLEDDGLPNQVVYAILPDAKGNLWLSTNNGLARLNRSRTQFYHLTSTDGLPANEFNRLFYTRLPGGLLCFDNTKGLVSFHPRDIPPDTVPPRITFTGLQLFNKPGSQAIYPHQGNGDPSKNKQVSLPWDQNALTFQFSAIDFRAPEKAMYSTKLEGVDEAWTPPSPVHSATYANLAPGKYTFRVRAANSNGIWNEEGLTLHVNILSPWWKTNWAYGIYAVLGIAAVVVISRFRDRQIRLAYSLENEKNKSLQLHEMNEMKGKFFSNITHEFRTPLTLILAPVDRLIDRISEPGMKKELVRTKRNAEHLLRLINQLLDMNKLDAGLFRIEPAYGELVRFMDNIVDSFSDLAKNRRIHLSFECDTDRQDFNFDPAAVEKIAYNLIFNALKFTEPGGKVTVSIRFFELEGKQWFKLLVNDTGTGIDHSKQKQIFSRYFQGSERNSTKGTGIGLALVSELVDLYGGSIELDSEPGRGTLFTISLPQLTTGTHGQNNHEPTLLPPKHLAQAANEEETPDKERDIPIVLVIEDNDDMRKFLVSALAGEFEGLEADNGKEGLKMAQKHIPDAIICDLMMPEMDGFQVISALKRESLTAHIPVVLLTARTSPESREKGLSYGADAYIKKPFYEKELLSILRNQLRIREQMWTRHQAMSIRKREDQLTMESDRFLKQLKDTILNHLEDNDFSIEDLARESALSRTQLHRKVKSLTGHSPGLFMRKVRLQSARELLESGEHTVAEVSWLTGFNTHSHFSHCFNEEFGVSPSAYQRQFERDKKEQ